MKRIGCLLSIIVWGHLSTFAQQKHKGLNLEKMTMSLSAEADMPVLNMNGSGSPADWWSAGFRSSLRLSGDWMVWQRAEPFR